MRRILLAVAAALTLVAATPLPPAPVRYVTDAAGVLPDDRESALNAQLEQLERDTSNQVIVYVDRRVPAGTTLEEMGAEAIRTWAVGQANKDNGAILFLFIEDRTSRIEVGYGLEGVLTDARSKDILLDLRPALQSGDYATAAELGATRIRETIAPPAASSAPADIDRTQREAVAARAADIAARDGAMAIPIGIFSVLFLTFILYTLYRVFIKGDWKLSGGSGFSSSSSFDSSSSGSSSSSSSDFSGGGGSGGGGGASDSW